MWQDWALPHCVQMGFGLFYFALNPTSVDTGGLVMADWSAPPGGSPEAAKLEALAQLPATRVRDICPQCNATSAGAPPGSSRPSAGDAQSALALFACVGALGLAYVAHLVRSHLGGGLWRRSRTYSVVPLLRGSKKRAAASKRGTDGGKGRSRDRKEASAKGKRDSGDGAQEKPLPTAREPPPAGAERSKLRASDDRATERKGGARAKEVAKGSSAMAFRIEEDDDDENGTALMTLHGKKAAPTDSAEDERAAAERAAFEKYSRRSGAEGAREGRTDRPSRGSGGAKEGKEGKSARPTAKTDTHAEKVEKQGAIKFGSRKK